MLHVSQASPHANSFTKIRSILFWWQKERPQYAHPWSAYSPGTYLAGAAPEGIVMATQVHSHIKVQADTSQTSFEEATKTSDGNLPEEIAIASAGKDVTPEKTAKIDTAVVSENLSKPTVHLKLVTAASAVVEAIEDTQKQALPALASSTGQNFQFAARLQSVSKLNRPLRTETMQRDVRSSGKKAGTNRPIQRATAPKRSRSINPPAVLHKQRKSAEVIQLNLTLARTQRKQSRIRHAA